jgi:hypothetical protein
VPLALYISLLPVTLPAPIQPTTPSQSPSTLIYTRKVLLQEFPPLSCIIPFSLSHVSWRQNGSEL